MKKIYFGTMASILLLGIGFANAQDIRTISGVDSFVLNNLYNQGANLGIVLSMSQSLAVVQTFGSNTLYSGEVILMSEVGTGYSVTGYGGVPTSFGNTLLSQIAGGNLNSNNMVLAKVLSVDGSLALLWVSSQNIIDSGDLVVLLPINLFSTSTINQVVIPFYQRQIIFTPQEREFISRGHFREHREDFDKTPVVTDEEREKLRHPKEHEGTQTIHKTEERVKTPSKESMPAKETAKTTTANKKPTHETKIAPTTQTSKTKVPTNQ